MGAMSRRKGKSGELEVVHLAQEAGFTSAKRSAPMQAGHGDGEDADVRGVGRLFVEVKRHRRVNVQACMRDLLATERPGFIRVLFHRDNGGVWLATIEATELLKLERDARATPAGFAAALYLPPSPCTARSESTAGAVLPRASETGASSAVGAGPCRPGGQS